MSEGPKTTYATKLSDFFTPPPSTFRLLIATLVRRLVAVELLILTVFVVVGACSWVGQPAANFINIIAPGQHLTYSFAVDTVPGPVRQVPEQEGGPCSDAASAGAGSGAGCAGLGMASGNRRLF